MGKAWTAPKARRSVSLLIPSFKEVKGKTGMAWEMFLPAVMDCKGPQR